MAHHNRGGLLPCTCVSRLPRNAIDARRELTLQCSVVLKMAPACRGAFRTTADGSDAMRSGAVDVSRFTARATHHWTVSAVADASDLLSRPIATERSLARWDRCVCSAPIKEALP